MAQYGMIYDTGSIKSQLAEANRDYYGRKTWEDLYGSIDYAKQKQLGQLEQDYSGAMAEAYASAYRSNQGIAASNLGEGYKAAAMEETDIALEEAYNAYKQNYLSGVAEIETAAAKQTQTVTDALTEQAEYIRDFANTPYQYLQYVFEQYGEGEQSENIFYNEEMWKRYTKEVKDEVGNLTGERELKSWEEIANYGAYEEITDEFGNTKKQWTGLYDESGNLTIKGADFFDQMINQLAYEGRGISFGQWLAENNQELYDWSQSYNPYDYTEAGSNLGSFKTMVGLTSTDEKYTFMERFGGLSKSEVDKMYSGFTSKLTELNRKVAQSSGRDAKEITTEFTDLTKEIGKLTDQLGITADIEDELGMSLDDLGKYLANNASAAVSNGDIWWQGILTTGASIGSGALIGAKFGGGWGALAGAIVGTIVGVISGISGSEQTKAQNRALSQASRDAYDELVTTLITY
ncbi:MAG: hypothetical protein IKA99_06455, partial [Clostridia bacterium]|nr:hypothetical protein [Clostridia bacterium]